MKWARRTDELEAFKTQINLCEYMASRGFALDRKRSSRRSATMRHANGDKLIVARGTNQHWKYFNVHDTRDKGTIIDFVQLRDRCTLGEVRQALRPWIGSTAQMIPTLSEKLPELAPRQRDLARVLTAWEKARPINGLHDYLHNERKIPLSILSDLIFSDRIRNGPHRNALFAHHDEQGLCGFEVKNRSFTGFSPGGTKSLFCSLPRSDDHELVLCETAIDALSYAALFGTQRRRFASTAGQVSPSQIALVRAAARNMPDGSTIILAMDHDAAGRRLVETLATALEKVDLPGTSVTIRLPDREGEDWNDVLRGAHPSLAPSPQCG